MKTKELQNKQHQKDFKNWVSTRKIEILTELSDVNFAIGDSVTFTNEFGVKFENLTVLGFCTPENERCVYLDCDSYWFPKKPKSLTLQK